MRGTVSERLWAKVDVRGPHDCWPWLAALNSLGYGSFWTGSKVGGAHRVAYQLVNGPVPAGLVIDHLCRNRACVNPAHMEPVTQRENVHRGAAPAAVNVLKTHCLNGHEFSAENTRIHMDGRRGCRICERIRGRENMRRRRARTRMAAS